MVVQFLKQGLTPHDLALTLAFGVTLGIFPVIGMTSVLCAVAGLVFRLNMVGLQSVNWAMSPAQIILLIPFTQAGGWIFGRPGILVSIKELKRMLEADLLGTITQFMTAVINGIVAWGMIAIPLWITVYLIFFLIFSKIGLTYTRETDSGNAGVAHPSSGEVE